MMTWSNAGNAAGQDGWPDALRIVVLAPTVIPRIRRIAARLAAAMSVAAKVALHRPSLLLRAHPMNDPQLIDTAPKKAEIIVFAAGRWRMGRWDDDRYATKPRPCWAWDGHMGLVHMRKNPPTHWLPMPPPPKTAVRAPEPSLNPHERTP